MQLRATRPGGKSPIRPHRRAWTAFALAGVTAIGATMFMAGTSSVTASVAHKKSLAPIIIGADVALSGIYQSLGIDDMAGLNAYVAYINSTGGVLGHKLQVVQENDQSLPSLGASIVQKLVSVDHAQFIMGPEETAVAEAAVPVLNSYHIVSLSWADSGWPIPGNSNADGHSYAFPGIAETQVQWGLSYINQLIIPRHYTRVAIIADNTPFASQFFPVLLQYQKAGKYKITTTQLFNSGATDVTAQVLNALATNPQLVIICTVPGTNSVTAIKALRAQNATIPFAVNGGPFYNPSIVAAAGGPSALQNAYTPSEGPQELLALPRGSVDRSLSIAQESQVISWLQKTGYSSILSNVIGDPEGWETGQELVAAIKAAGSTNTAKVKAALQHQQIDTEGVIWKRTPKNYGAVLQLPDPEAEINLQGTTYLSKVYPNVVGGK